MGPVLVRPPLAVHRISGVEVRILRVNLVVEWVMRIWVVHVLVDELVRPAEGGRSLPELGAVIGVVLLVVLVLF